MDSDQGKLFIGGISWETNEDKLKEHFSNYGDVLRTTVMRDKVTGRPRGFGFVVFADPSVVDTVLQEKHLLDGREVDVKRAMSREEQQVSGRSGNFFPSRNSGSGGNIRTKKIFVGGLPPTLTEEGFSQYFEAYGRVTDVVIMYDQITQRPRGFGFISFDTEDAVDRVLHKTFHDLNGKQVEVKRALPKDANPGGSGRSISGGSGGYPSYISSGGSGSGYDGRMDSNSYMQSQSAGSGFPPYGSSGYGAGYGYGSNGVGYGGYGGFPGVGPGYGGPAGAPFGNPNVPGAAFGSGPAVGPRSTWSAQPSGYGSVGYGAATPWGGAASGALSSALAGQSPVGASGYLNQGFGYSGYGGSDSSYGNLAGYGGFGGRMGGAPNISEGGGGGYGDGSWRTDSSQGSGNYGNSGYGGQGRPTQQQ